MASEVLEARKRLLELDSARLRLESEIASRIAVLDGLRVGMHEPLVDAEGFPRADVDLLTVRTLRSEVIALSRDHADTMKRVEEALHALHALGPVATAVPVSHRSAPSDVTTAPAPAPPSSAPASTAPHPRPFARVDAVSAGSPAAVAGIRINDELCRVGDLCEGGDGALPSLPRLALYLRERVDTPLDVLVRRPALAGPTGSADASSYATLVLTPGVWSGPGVLGCHVLPVDT